MSDEPLKPDSEERPMSDRRTIASKFGHSTEAEDTFQDTSEPGISPIDSEPRLGRDLTHEDYQTPSGKLNMLEGDSLFERIRPYALFIFFGGIFLIMLVLAAIKLDFFEEKEPVEDQPNASLVSRPTVSRSVGELNPAVALAEDNTAAMGGYERLKRLSSLTVRGVLEKDGKETPFTLFARRPNYYRLVFDLGGTNEYIVGFDGQVAWESYRHDGLAVKSNILDEEARNKLVQDADFDLPIQKYILVSEYSNDRRTPIMDMTLLTREMIDNTVYEVVRIKEKDRPTINAYIGASSNLLHQTVTNINGVEIRNEYDDYRLQDGAYFPYLRQHYSDGKLTATTRIDSVTYNPGMLTGMFSLPKQSDR